MEFNKLYKLVTGQEEAGYAKTQGTLNNRKVAANMFNPNNRYRVEVQEGPDGRPTYSLFNVDLDKLDNKQKFYNLQLLYNFANNNKIQVEPFQPCKETCGAAIQGLKVAVPKK